MIIVPPRHFCVILDPYIREDEKTKKAAVDQHGQVRVRHGDREIRFAEDWPEPFPLLPGETMEGNVSPVTVIAKDTALRLMAKRDFKDETTGTTYVAGDEWLFHGPATYRMRVEVEIKELVSATMILKDHALKLQARNRFVSNGVERKSGEEWLVRTPGAYMPHVDEKVVAEVKPIYLLQTRALHLRAANAFTDVYGIPRKAGEEWLVTNAMSEIHLQDVHEEIVNANVSLTVLGKLQYCIVLDPADRHGKVQYGARELRKGEVSFFLQPGESLDGGIQNVAVLGQEEALLLRAKEAFKDGATARNPGDQWMIQGPCDYIPPVEVEVVEKRTSIPLDENEGIYVRDNQTGKISALTGRTYMLKAHEELWPKELSPEVEGLLKAAAQDDSKKKARDKTRVVDYRVPHNAAVQIYDYNKKKSRVVFGPALVMLDPDEQFTVLSLSGDKPKRPNVIKSLALSLGPDFMTDIVEVETADHARLRLQLSYNWQFELANLSNEEKEKIFQVRDFVGDTCKAIGGRVRGAVATSNFDDFHKNSARVIRAAVFGLDERGKINDEFHFNSNHLSITNIDIQSVEPVDERTRESLQKSVQLAIEITTKKQERNARHAAGAIEQDARSKIERQKISNQTEAEEAKQSLIQLQAESAAVASTGTAKAEAEAKAEYYEIESTSDVEQAGLSAQASTIEAKAGLEEEKATQDAQLAYENAIAQLDLRKSERLASIETGKFKQLVDAISPETIKAIARAGPEMQAKLLKGLGLKGYLMTDGNSPINLFNAAKGMVSAGGMPGMSM
jgi:major vault protein